MPAEAEIPLPAFDAGQLAFAANVIASVQIAAQQQPELLRALLSEVFDLAAIRNQMRHQTELVREHGREAQEARHHLEDLGRVVAELERRVDAIDGEFDRLAQRLQKLNRFLDGVAERVKHLNRRTA